MNIAILSALLLVGHVSSAPTTTTNDEKLVVNEEFFPDSLKVYEGKHDIVKIYLPLNKLNFDDDTNDDAKDREITIFFVEADLNGNEQVDQGLYVKIGETVKKLLDHGRDIAAPSDESETAFFAAKDGIYVYNPKETKADKYGSVEDDLIGIVVGNTSHVMYVLSADKKVYKVTGEGNKLELVDEIKNAEQIVLDYKNNLFYIDSEKKIYIVNNDGVRNVVGLPENAAKIKLITPPFIFEDGGIPVVADKKIYTIHPNATVEEEDIVLDTEITAYSVEASLIQYYAREKKIYQYNILELLISSILEDLKEYIENMKNEIDDIATKSRKQFVTAKA